MQANLIASAFPLERSEAMFDSVKNWLNRTDQHQADKQKLEAEAKNFRLPSETIPQVCKYLLFSGLAFFNYRLFAHVVPGVWGHATGAVAIMAEAIALYSTHNFSRSSGLFRWTPGASAIAFMTFCVAHGTFSFFDLIGVAEISEAVRFYSQRVAFPLLAGLLVVSVVVLTMAHPKNLIRIKQALAHTAIVTGRAKAASELELMRAQSVLDQAHLDQQRERTRREQEYLSEVDKLIAVEERKRAMVAAISDAGLREALPRELAIDFRQPQAGAQHRTAYQSPNWQTMARRGNGSVLD